MSAAGDKPQKSAAWGDLRSRAISAVVLGLLVLALTFAGGWPFRILCCATGVIVLDEWARMTRAKRAGPIFVFARRCLFVALALFLLDFRILSIVVAAGGCLFIALVDRREHKADWVVGGLAYAATAALAPGMLRGDDDAGLLALGLVIAVVWATDIAAYFSGRTFGGPKLMPAVSPKKTISGAVGGLVAGVAAGSAAYCAVTGRVDLFIILLTAALSVLGQAGDLFESWVKRRFGVKDSGRIIPGHGGLMDRIDALIIALAAAWLVGVTTAGFAHPARAIFNL
ncbi:phosphatidate cytidylyltransferase [Mangrovicella endophytica]|uniref:phosphatidate cytidylyltransferase n=1 Tax=Mangrovicella endophytica TaxID=2066697 RepID=UPI001FE0F47B|nr:phosphatidate cytidylyltransferase [Mangrovicella endophytica]